MSLITWNEKYSVKVQEFDNQHKKLIELINKLHDSMKQRKTKEVLSGILKELVNYTETHFKTEEKYFDKYGYVNSPTHKREHIMFTKKVVDLNKGHEEGKLMISMETMNFLKDWLMKHIQGTDQKYSSFFNEKGLK